MDDNYRAKLDEGMGDLLKDLEGEAREKGDYCKKHDLYIGDAKMCPWCEIDALNEKCSPGDLKASVVATWPMAARRAMMYFQVAEGDAANELERLREENADLRSRLDEWVNLGNQYLFGNAVDNMVKANKDAVFTDEMLHIITTDQIRAARKWIQIWPKMVRDRLYQLLEHFNITRCEGCGGRARGWIDNDPNAEGSYEAVCQDCNGEGWVVKDE